MNDIGTTSPALAENPYVQELFSIMQENGKDTQGLSALLGHVSEMESFVKRAEDKIADMKSQLSEMKEVQNHPVKTALTNAIKALETKVTEVKAQLTEIKANIIEGCKSAVTAFKEKGATVLNNLASFFKVNRGLQAINRSADDAITQCDRAVAKINSFANEYHSAGRAIKNMGRMLVGKELLDAKKEAGKLSKVMSASYKAQKAAMKGVKKAANKAISAIERLDEQQAAKKQERSAEKRPDFMARLNKLQERVELNKLELPVPERAKAKGAEI
jgi:ABC-type transporter Mla subunit MlaD